VEIDGSGLISRKALDQIWKAYNEHHKTTSYEKSCPYTGFQGRLGGFKGTWILDESLGETVVVHCRESQLKVRAIMESIVISHRKNTHGHLLYSFTHLSDV